MTNFLLAQIGRTFVFHTGPEKTNQIHAVVATLEEQLLATNQEIDSIRKETLKVEATSSSAKKQIDQNQSNVALQMKVAAAEVRPIHTICDELLPFNFCLLILQL